MSFWKRILIALTSGTLLFGGELRMFSSPRNRFFYMWEQRDAVILLAGIVAVALVILLIGAAVDRLGGTRLRRLFDHVLLFFSFSALLGGLLKDSDWKSGLALIAAACALTYSWCRPELRIDVKGMQALLIFSPFVGITVGRMFGYHSWASPKEELPASTAKRQNASPIFLFVFDEWSYIRSVDADGVLLPSFKNLRRFCETASYFTNARSPGMHTQISLPSICFQTVRKVDVDDSKCWFVDGDRRAFLPDQPSLFSAAKDHGYETRLLGFYLPYRQMLGTALDYCTSYSLYSHGDTIAEGALGQFLYSFDFLHDPISEKIHGAINASSMWRTAASEKWRRIHEELRPKVHQLIRTAPDQSFTMIHFPCPHPPYIYDAQGKYIGPITGRTDNPYDPAGYVRHLQYLDFMAGDYLRELEREGRLDRAMVIFTSDHSWRKDARGGVLDPEEMRHVPLLIKFPHQKTPQRIEERYYLTKLQPLMNAVLSQQVATEESMDLVKRHCNEE